MECSTPLIAIIIPAYKATFLGRTLNSILCQTDKRFRVYVGDDCSPYDIEGIVREYKEKLPLTYRRFKTNLGSRDLVAQWERCIAMSDNEPYIWLFSDDDEMDPRCVEIFLKQPQEIRDHAITHFNIDVIDPQDKLMMSPSSYPYRISAEDFLHLKLTGKIISYVVEFIFPRRIYNEVKGFKNFDLAWGSDFVTWIDMACCASDGIITPEGAKVRWRSSDENISPRKDRTTLIRKIKSLIGNAKCIKTLIKENPDKFPGSQSYFRWIRFPLGEIIRNYRQLGILHSVQLIITYFQRVFLLP